jgi:heme O synthase-like polyprenyltransferase
MLSPTSSTAKNLMLLFPSITSLSLFSVQPQLHGTLLIYHVLAVLVCVSPLSEKFYGNSYAIGFIQRSTWYLMLSSILACIAGAVSLPVLLILGPLNIVLIYHAHKFASNTHSSAHFKRLRTSLSIYIIAFFCLLLVTAVLRLVVT